MNRLKVEDCCIERKVMGARQVIFFSDVQLVSTRTK